MSPSRRKWLSLIGGGIVVAAAVPASAFLTTRQPDKALAPWHSAGQYDDPRLRALSYALLAPNPHNRQPWEIELIGGDRLAVYRDKTRNLPVTDPYDRQLTIGMGCFLELMTMAAAQENIAVSIELYPDGENGPVARCHFRPNAATPDPLFIHALRRRTHRGAFEDKSIALDAAKSIGTLADLYLPGPDAETLRNLAVNAWHREVATPAAWEESVNLLRIGKAEVNANPDGITLFGPMIDTLALFGLMTRDVARDVDSAGSRQQIERMVGIINSAPGFVLLRSQKNSRIDQIAAGGRWLRLNLLTTRTGLRIRPVSQALQEYPEMADIYTAIHRDYAEAGETIQMFGLLGYGGDNKETPRWPLETRMRNG